MDNTNTLVLYVLTFSLAPGNGIGQYRRAKAAREEHHRSACANANNAPRPAHDPCT